MLAELYAQAMKAKGVNASTKLNIGSREVYIKALQDESISMVPEYTGNLLLNFDKTATAKTRPRSRRRCRRCCRPELQVLKTSPAADQDVYVVTKDYAAKNGIASLEDLKKVASTRDPGRTVGAGDSDLRPPRAREEYGVKLKAFKPYDSAGGAVQGPQRRQDPVGESSSPPRA